MESGRLLERETPRLSCYTADVLRFVSRAGQGKTRSGYLRDRSRIEESQECRWVEQQRPTWQEGYRSAQTMWPSDWAGMIWLWEVFQDGSS